MERASSKSTARSATSVQDGSIGQKGHILNAADRRDISHDDYFQAFKHAPISLWEEDFSEVKRNLDHLKSMGVSDFRKYFSEHPEDVLAFVRMVKIVKVNDTTLSLFKADSLEEFCRNLSVFFNTESYEVFKEELMALVEGNTVFSSEAINMTLTGDRREILIRVTIPPGFEESWSKVYVAIKDITALKGMERELTKIREEISEVF